MDDLMVQLKELKEEPHQKVIDAIGTAIIQSYTIGQEDLKKQGLKNLKKASIAHGQGAITFKKRTLLVADVLNNFDIVLPKD